MGSPILAYNDMSTWPSLSEAHYRGPITNTPTTTNTSMEMQMEQPTKGQDEEESSWEVVSAENSNDEENTVPPSTPSSIGGLHKSVSTPSFRSCQQNLDCNESIDGSFVLEYPNTTTVSSEGEDDEEDTTTVTDGEFVSLPSPPPKRSPSFKDAILLNAAEVLKEEAAAAEEAAAREELRKRQIRKPREKRRIIVNSIKRCSKSTGDLGSLLSIQETCGGDGDCGGGGGGGGGQDMEMSFVGNSMTIDEDEVMGETDASDYYHRKRTGMISRKNGQKLRPDEAKRKDSIVSKKNAQRRAQTTPQKQKDRVKVTSKRISGRKKI